MAEPVPVDRRSDELPVQRLSEKQDADAPVTRDYSSWFEEQLGEEWLSEEPGIYRFVGPTVGPANTSASMNKAAIEDPKAAEAPEPARAGAPRVGHKVLELRAPAAPLDVLKTKREHDSAFDKARLAPAEGATLKEKLASAGKPEDARRRINGRAS
jgi:hypothetical protein